MNILYDILVGVMLVLAVVKVIEVDIAMRNRHKNSSTNTFSHKVNRIDITEQQTPVFTINLLVAKLSLYRREKFVSVESPIYNKFPDVPNKSEFTVIKGNETWVFPEVYDFEKIDNYSYKFKASKVKYSYKS